jgi:DNA replication protein DnaC
MEALATRPVMMKVIKKKLFQYSHQQVQFHDTVVPLTGEIQQFHNIIEGPIHHTRSATGVGFNILNWNTGESIWIRGGAGVGKSFLLNMIRIGLKKYNIFGVEFASIRKTFKTQTDITPY